jgi:hypothetical protein
VSDRIEALEDALRQEIEFSQNGANGHAKHR